MSKGEGRKVAIKFTEELVGLGVTPTEGYPELKVESAIMTASSQYSSTYSPDKAFDGNISTYWDTRQSVPQWIQAQLATAVALTRFRWYVGSYAPNGFLLQGSNDGFNWDTLFQGESTSATGWKEFIFPNSGKYLYYRWNIDSLHSSRLYIYEIEMFYKEFQNESAFRVSGQQHKYVNGPLIDATYAVVGVEHHPTEPRTILLTVDQFSRFENAEGVISVAYDASRGNLVGAGGSVEPFVVDFLPTGLVQEPNPGIEEIITVEPIVTLTLTSVSYAKAYDAEEVIIAAPALVTVVLTDASIINP